MAIRLPLHCRVCSVGARRHLHIRTANAPNGPVIRRVLKHSELALKGPGVRDNGRGPFGLNIDRGAFLSAAEGLNG
ncbi:hypothetical protein EVAR_27600_1 [Eumeta japonica]|uniref:Uncharacterized protein n=1 Tax=Eumeta variegata TaxID=151549 RepID=A0A4C1V1L7_EUMVA|nr:hypothetical protein EVAR_27600_1 [Eumeta japonica]